MPKTHNIEIVKFYKTRTSKSLSFMRILSNDFKIIVVLKSVTYYLQLRSVRLCLKNCCPNFTHFLWFNSIFCVVD